MDIPDDLRTDLLKMISIFGTNKHLLMFGAATEILTHHLGTDFFNKNFSAKKPDAFLGEFLALSDPSSDYQYRFMTWASYVFSLREADGFDTLIERFKTRQLRQTYFEARAMHLLQKEGFNIRMQPETGVKGQDFDFVASKHDRHFNVEVTALTAPEFQDATVRNALKQKQKQVPKDAPGLLFCTVPFGWIETAGSSLTDRLKLLALNFFRNSRRFNAVIFSMDSTTVVGSRQMRGILSNPVLHENPYFVEDLNFLFNPSNSAESVLKALAVGRIPDDDVFDLSYRSLIEELLTAA